MPLLSVCYHTKGMESLNYKEPWLSVKDRHRALRVARLEVQGVLKCYYKKYDQK